MLKSLCWNAGASTIETGSYLYDFDSVDPRHEKERILAGKDKLLEGSCSWIFQDPAFTRWWNREDVPNILWVHGGPGKGKTMIMAAMIDEVSRRMRQQRPHSTALAYFFCQQTEDRLNSAVAIMKGLIYFLIPQHRAFSIYFKEKYHKPESQRFKDISSLWSLWCILKDMLEYANLPDVCLMIDALDECVSGMPEFLRLLERSTCQSKVRWLITSRNERPITDSLQYGCSGLHISLDLNLSHVSAAVDSFVNTKVQELAHRKQYSKKLEADIREYLLQKAQGTFLWVSLVCEELQKAMIKDTRTKLYSFPPGLEALYAQMLRQVENQPDHEAAEFCKAVLRAVVVAQRPRKLIELPIICQLPSVMHEETKAVEDLIDQCASFLNIQECTVYLVHQSSTDFFVQGEGRRIFEHGLQEEHRKVAQKSLEIMADTLKRNICGLESPDASYEEIGEELVRLCLPPHLEYACCYWIKHIKQAEMPGQAYIRLFDYDEIYDFLKKQLLHWFEALSLLRRLSEGVLGLEYLEACEAVSEQH